MNVTCPQCRTVYRLPDEKAKAGTKLRCSVCRHIFLLPEEAPVELVKEAPLSLGGTTEEVRIDTGMELNGFPEAVPASKSGESLSLGGGSAEPQTGGLDIAIENPKDTQDKEKSGDDAEAADNLSLSEDTEAPSDQLDMPDTQPSRTKGAFSLIFCVATIIGVIWAWNHTDYLDGVKRYAAPYLENTESQPASSPSAIEKLELLDWQQYLVKNEKIGDLIVIEGKVKNNFTEARELIQLEAGLCGADGKVLASQRQIAGVSLSSFQLKVLDKNELESALNSRVEIISSNINVAPGAEVPFTIVFSEIPAGASDYKVRIIDAVMPKKAGNLSE